MKTNLEIARECGMNEIRGGGWWFNEDAQLDAFVARIQADECERCAVLCEAETGRARWIRGAINGEKPKDCAIAAAIRKGQQ